MKKLSICVLLLILLLMTGCGDSNESNITIQRGVVSENTYESFPLGLKLTLGDEWAFCTKEEIAELNKMSTDKTAFLTTKQIEEAGIVYDMLAKDGDTGSVIVSYEKLNVINNGRLSVQDYMQRSQKKLNSTLKQQKFSDIDVQQDSTMIAGNEWQLLRVSAKIQDIPFYQTLAFYQVEDCIACISIGNYSEDISDEILALFSKL